MPLPNLMHSLQLGQQLMVETQREILIGNLKLIDAGGKIIELDNVRDFNTNYEYTSSQILPVPQIKTIKIIQNDDNEETIDSKPTISSSSTSSLSSTTTPPTSPAHFQSERCQTSAALVQERPDKRCANLSSRELLLIQEQLGNINYIVQTDQLYHKALADIKGQSVISLILDPMAYGRHNKTSLLVVGTSRAVYIFDILNLGKVFREFKDILESKQPRKSLHYGHRIVDNLMHRQRVQLAGIFDTFVAHCLIADKKTPISLIQMAELYFNIPELYFTASSQTTTMQQIDAFRRPVTKEHLQLLAKQAIFQYKLYEHLLHEQMLANFYQECELFSRTFSSNEDSVDVAMQMKPSSRQGFEHIRPEGAWNEFLDKDF